MSKSTTSTTTRLVRAGVATALVSAAAVVGTASPAMAIPVTLSSAAGPSGTSNITITGSAATNFLTGSTAPVAYFMQAACPATWTTATFTTPVAPTSANTGISHASVVKKLANNKFAVTVPNSAPNVVTTISPAASSKYNLCVYPSGTAGALLAANAVYTVAAAATVTSITPAAGPPTGGNTVTVTGSGFPTTAGALTAALDGKPLTGISNVTATSFTAIAPPHGFEDDVTLTVTTASGTTIMKDAYDYVNGISIAPNTAPNTTTAVDVDVIGSGFLDYDFTSTAAVYLVNGVYDPSTPVTNKANGPVAECTGVLVVADNELICTLNLTHRLTAAGNFTPITRVTSADGNTTSGSRTVTSASGAFTTADVGSSISGTGIPTGTTIVTVNSPTSVTISADATGTGTTAALTLGGPIRSGVTLTALTSGSTAITASASTFTTADIGRPIVGTGIADGTVITAVAAGGGAATLSKAATGTGTPTVALYTARRVPDDAYVLTVVSHKADDAATTVPEYQQTIVSSGSTFTVAPY